MIQDIRETGGLNYRDLQNENSFDTPTFRDPVATLRSMTTSEVLRRSVKKDRDVTEEALASGFGSSRWDKHFTSAEEVEDNRAHAQTTGSKWLNAAVKASILASTTFVDGMLGTTAGLIWGVANWFDTDKSTTFMDGFINNPISLTLSKINEWSEKALPNHRTRDEIENPWKHVWSANFWGDTILKNAGFMIGMGLSGKVNAGLVGKVMKMDKLRNAYKGLVAAAGGKGDDAAKMIGAIASGDKTIDGVKLTDELVKSAKKLKANEQILSLTGSVASAFGESRLEAINGTNEWKDYHTELARGERDKALANIDYLVLENPENYSLVLSGNSESGYRYDKQLNEKGLAEKARLEREIEKKFQDALVTINKEGAKMANTIFGVNMVLLTAGNIAQFGKYFAGGYNTGKLVAAEGISDAIKGGIKEGYELIKSNLKSPATALSRIAVESNEEMMQSATNEIAGLSAASRFNSFYGHKVDPDAEENSVSFVKALGQGLQNTYGDKNTWVEGFAGAFSSLVGLPSFSKVQTQNGGTKTQVKWNSAITEAIEIAKQNKEAQSIVDNLNKAVQSKEFIDRWEGITRHLSYQAEKDAFLAQDKEFNFKNSDLGQRFNDILMFQKAGRVQDLIEYAEGMDNLSPENIEEIRLLTTNQNTGKSIFDGKSDQEVIEHITKQKESILKDIKNFQEVTSNLKVLYGDNIDDDVLTEIGWMTTQINDWEERGKSLFDGIKSALKDKADEISKKTGTDVESLLLKNYNDVLNEVIDPKLAKEIYRISNDHNLTVQEQREEILQAIDKRNAELAQTLVQEQEASENGAEAQRDVQKQKSDLLTRISDLSKQLENTNNLMIDPVLAEKTQKQLIDLAKIQASRLQFIYKLGELSKNPGEFTKEAIQMKRQAMSEAADKFVDKIAVKAMSATNMSELSEALSEAGGYGDKVLDRIEASSDNPKTKQLVKNYRELSKSNTILSNIINSRERNETTMSAASLIGDAFNNSESVEQARSVLKEYLDSDEIPQEVKDEISSIMSSYDEQYKSSSTSEADSNKNTGSRKAQSSSKKEAPSALDNFADSSEEVSEQEKKREGSRKPNNPNNPSDNPPPTSSNSSQEDGAAKDDESSSSENSNEHTEAHGATMPQGQEGSAEYNAAVEAKKELPPVHSSSQGQNGQTEYEENIPEKKNYIQKLTSWVQTLFDYDQLKNKLTRKMVRRDNAITKALYDLGVYDYVDSGKLAEKVLENPGLPIHFITISEGPLKSQVLLGIELNPNEKNDKFITTQDGKRYQIVGSLGYSRSTVGAKKDFNKIYNKVMNEAEGTQGYFVSSAYTKVTHLYSGRMVKSDVNNDVSQRTISKAFMRGRPLHLGVLYSQGNFKTPTIDSSMNPIVIPNTNNQNPREGSVWLMVKEADGSYYPKAITVKRFTPQEYPLDEFGNSPIVKEIKQHLRTLLDSNASYQDKLEAKFALKDLLHFPAEHDIIFRDKSSLVSLKGGYNNIGGKESTLDEAVKNAFNTLYNSGLNLRFNIATYRLGMDTEYSDLLLQSGVLSTDLLLPFNVNASFDVAPIDDNGRPIEDNEYKTTGHTGTTGVQSTLNSRTFVFNGKTVRQIEGEQVKVEGYSDADSNTIAAIINNIVTGKIPAIEDNPNVFEIKTPTGESWYMIRDNGGGFRIPSQEEINRIVERANKKAAESKQQEAVSSILDEMEEEPLTDTQEESQPTQEGQNTQDTQEESSPTPSETLSEVDSFLDAGFEIDEDDSDAEETPSESSDKSSEDTIQNEKVDTSKPTNVTDDIAEVSVYREVLNSDESFERMEQLKFDSILELVEFCEKRGFKDPRTIKSQEEANLLFDEIEECS